jgi:hypothetical protein
MNIILQLLFASAVTFSYQIVQKNKEVQVQGQGEWPEEIVVNDGDLKLKIEDGVYDIFSETKLRFDAEAIIHIHYGTFRIRRTDATVLKVSSPVAMATLSAGDFIIQYHPDRALVEIKILDGSALLQGHYRDEILNLQKGELGQFVGVPESDGPAYDVLLKGRKSIRGHLGGPEKLSELQIKELAQSMNIQLRVVKAKVKPKPKPGQICSEPFARFNECVWRCVTPGGKSLAVAGACQNENPKAECVRERCLASGQWGDRSALKGAANSACRKGGIFVGPCDY